MISINITIDKMTDKYHGEILNLAKDMYMRSKSNLKILPDLDSVGEILSKSISHLFESGEGIVALSNNKLVGYIGAYTRNRLWGHSKGLYSPLYAFGTADLIQAKKERLIERLFSAFMGEWASKGFLDMAITLYNNDAIVLNAIRKLGFGSRCVDSIASLPIKIDNARTAQIKIISKEDRPFLRDLWEGLIIHLQQPPCFMRTAPKNWDEDFSDWVHDNSITVVGAFFDDNCVGYIQVNDKGESFVSMAKEALNINGAFVSYDNRGKGISDLLLSAVSEYAASRGYSMLGVDYECFNVEGRRFWEKKFTPYTDTMVRVLDLEKS